MITFEFDLTVHPRNNLFCLDLAQELQKGHLTVTQITQSIKLYS